ncbi:MAG TPA: hypothetical protein PLI27_01215 [Ignavibacteriales bacterium]|nr:hypothetical protein [Ignavibacteriales bacterium]HOL80308.1 hypothetical protein [Ignavibacteriales bacterium]HOM64587.1 hypothetical protein [Ignavibacteriales bacterium]HPD66684.1 hypothetical protein [Ignavibacteriales bacterium]HPP32497.1 hypothetical protein [Ignavibacteriales bacterium]
MAKFFLDESTAAYANMSIMRNVLREFWINLGKASDFYIPPIPVQNFLNKKGENITDTENNTISIPVDILKEWTYNRILDGIKEFLGGFKQAFKNIKKDEPVHVFLSGNASKSLVLQAIMDALFNDGNNLDSSKYSDDLIDFATNSAKIENFNYKIEYHLPLINEDNDYNKPNCKTATALGLLELCTYEENYKIDDKTQNKKYFILGTRIRDNFKIIIKDAKSEWYDFGKVSNTTKCINIFYTNKDSILLEDNISYDDNRLSRTELNYEDKRKDLRCFIKPIDNSKIQYTFALTEEDINEKNIKKLELKFN